MEFQSWKVNFKTEVCSKTADLHLTMQGIKEVEIAKSMNELVTSRSITGRNDFPDYDMLDAMIAKTSRQAYSLPQKSRCRRAACSKIRPILTRKTKLLYEHFRATGGHEAVQGLSDLFSVL